jgi:hypothetical protein
MSAPDNKVLMTVLWERVSGRGNEYLSGFLGRARVVAFRGEPTPDGIKTWNVYLSPAKEQEEAGERREARQPRQQPTGSTSSPSASPPPAGRVQRPQRPDAKPAEAEGRPFHDDPIDDIGRDR